MTDEAAELPIAEVFREYVYYVNCPHCDSCVSLGEESPEDGEEIICEDCEKCFTAYWSEE